uniref:Uncharacterized protein n=1 Tax=Anguilla anguilla TaxID=7936 RepID=A0A0E9WHF2_ANGAN
MVRTHLSFWYIYIKCKYGLEKQFISKNAPSACCLFQCETLMPAGCK